MKRRKTRTTLKQISDLNMTPLMDLTFILLITFIVTFPMMEQGVPIKLPKGKAKKIEADKAQTVSLNGEGKVFLNQEPIELERLGVVLREMIEGDPETLVFVRADKGIAYGEVMDVLRTLQEAKVTRMALVTQEG